MPSTQWLPQQSASTEHFALLFLQQVFEAVQRPSQHSASAAQASPLPPQHVPSAHLPEQQSSDAWQAWRVVAQLHLPSVHVPAQQLSFVQSPPTSAQHSGCPSRRRHPHFPSVHSRDRHSPASWQSLFSVRRAQLRLRQRFMTVQSSSEPQL
jgi:hypothetical protein